MKLLLINSVCGIRSTGRICANIAEYYEKKGWEVKIAYGREEPSIDTEKWAVRIGKQFDLTCHGIATRLFDSHGFSSVRATKDFLKWVEEYSPDLLWLHNLHGYYINVELLFEWIKQRTGLKVKWTLHDCWAFTGHCSYFTMVNCKKWKTLCKKCPQKREYPSSWMIDGSSNNYYRKKNAFCGVKNLSLITPSKWLAGLVKQSYLNEYPVEVYYNKIDHTVFCHRNSNFRLENSIEEKIILLGVASPWSKRKGLEDLIWLSHHLDERFEIVLVGVSDSQIRDYESQITGKPEAIGPVQIDLQKIDTYVQGMIIPAQKEYMLKAILQKFNMQVDYESKAANVRMIKRTNNSYTLAEIYSTADVFLNPTYEDNYPTVNLEARACGTFVISYDTGGCRETLEEAY